MASCEIILDVSNYQKIPDAPAEQDRVNYGEAYFTQKLREHELAKAGNTIKKRFSFAVRWFLEKQLKFDDIKIAGVDTEAIELEGLKILDGTSALTDEAKARFLSVAGLLIADSQLDALSGKSPPMLSTAAGDEIADLVEGTSHFKVYVSAAFKSALTRALAEYNTYPALFQRVYVALRAKAKSSSTPNDEY